MAVDFEERVNYRRLHEYRIARARRALEASELGALLVFDVNNIRYLTSTKIGEWERDKFSRWVLLPRGGEPILWDFGSAAVHHKLHCPWLRPENVRAGLIGLRGTIHPDFGLMERHAKEIFALLKEAGAERLPLGVDVVEPPMMFRLQQLGIKVVDAQQTMLEAREIKNVDEIALLNRAAAMVDGAYQLINDMLRPGIRENDVVAEVNKFLYIHGSDDVEAVNAISGERCNPHPHNFTDRMIRPGPRRSSTSCSRLWVIEPVTTAHSMLDARRPRNATRIKRPVNGWITRWFELGRVLPRRTFVQRSPRRMSLAFRMRCPPLDFSLHTGSASPCTSVQSFRGSFRWTTPLKSKRGWCSP
jgi:Creatinase/Prolidase N-terminal domain